MGKTADEYFDMQDQKPIDVEATPQALVVHQPQEVAPPGLFGTQEPVAIIEKATSVATALKAVIDRQGLISRISGKEYPKCEAWTLLGTMLGVFPVLLWTKPVEGGWEARVEARTKDGSVVGAAEAQCLRAERNWSNRDDFALRSMAQTRATAKCLRMPLGFVMTLAGYQPTPAEEMVADHPPESRQAAPGRTEPPARPQHAPPASKAAAQAKPATALSPFLPTEESRTKMIAALKAGPGEPNRAICTEFFRKVDGFGPDSPQLAPFEEIESLRLNFVPATTGQMKALAEMLARFGNGDQISQPFPPHKIDDDGDLGPQKPKAAVSGVKSAAEIVPKVVPEATPAEAGAAKDPLWWRNVIVSRPRKGMKKADYDRNPDTLGALYDLRHGNDEEAQAARQRLWGIMEHAPEPQEWQGKTYQPSEADWVTYRAAQAFGEWFKAKSPRGKAMTGPDEHTLANRRAAIELAREAAMHGDPIAGALFELKSAAGMIPGGSFLATTGQDFRDEDEDDYERPY